MFSLLLSPINHRKVSAISHVKPAMDLSHGVVISLWGIYNFGFICSSGINAFVSCKRRFRHGHSQEKYFWNWGLSVTVEITKWASSQLCWEDGYLNCKSISKLGTYVKWEVRITIKGCTTEVFWRWETETNIYWILYARKCARHPHTSLVHLKLPAIL